MSSATGSVNDNGKRTASRSPSLEDTPAAKAANRSSSTTSDDNDDTEDRQQAVNRSRTQGIKPGRLTTISDLYKSAELKVSRDEDVGRSDRKLADEKLNDKLVLWQGDITKLEVDCIVNAANKSLLGGGGVDGAIHSAAGRSLLAECRKLGGAATGEVKLTSGHALPARMIAHAVGPVYSKRSSQKSEELLRSCYRNTLDMAVENELRTVAFPGISTGVYGYPLDDATNVVLDEVHSFLTGDKGSKIDTVIFAVFGDKNLDSYKRLLPMYFPPPEA